MSKEFRTPQSNYCFLVDDQDWDLVATGGWYAKPVNLKIADGFAYLCTQNIRLLKTYGYWPSKSVYLHRLILSQIVGRRLLRSEEVDHIDCNKQNNCRNNLRIASHAENMGNLRLTKKAFEGSGCRGVYRHADGAWVANISKNDKTIYLGYFDDPIDAAIAYHNSASDLFGKFYDPHKSMRPDVYKKVQKRLNQTLPDHRPQRPRRGPPTKP